MWRSASTLLIAVIAPPRDAFGARLKDAVMDGNCPWWLMTSASFVFSKCAKALSGMALLLAELAVPRADAVGFEADADAGERAFVAAASVFAAGVYRADAVSALDPAALDPEDENEDEAPVPVAPAEAFDRI